MCRTLSHHPLEQNCIHIIMGVYHLKSSIESAQMTHSKSNGYVGTVVFRVEHHKEPYEITLHSKSAKDWSYSLHFHGAPGSEQEIFAVEELVEEDDEYFESIIEAAMSSLKEELA